MHYHGVNLCGFGMLAGLFYLSQCGLLTRMWETVCCRHRVVTCGAGCELNDIDANVGLQYNVSPVTQMLENFLLVNWGLPDCSFVCGVKIMCWPDLLATVRCD